MNKGGAPLSVLKRAWKLARLANLGRPKTREEKRKARITKLKNQRENRDPFSKWFPEKRLHKGRHASGEAYGWYFWDEKKKRMVRQCRAVFEKFYRKLRRGEIVHHIDGNKLNDEPKNLIALTRKAHRLLHQFWEIVNVWEGKNVDGKLILKVWKAWYDSF